MLELHNLISEMPLPAKRARVSDENATPAGLVQEGATLVVLGVPPGTEFGVDLNSWNTGEKFCGVKLIPPGLHFLYYSSVHLPTRTTAPRTGWFHTFGRGELVVKRWSPEGEEVIDSSEEEVERVKADLRGIDCRLGAYPYDSWSKWISLSNKVTEATVNRLEPTGGKICSVADLVPSSSSSPPSTTVSPCLPDMVHRPGTAIRYTVLDGRKFPEGSTAAQITLHSLDSSFQLTSLLSTLGKLYTDQVSGGSMGHSLERELLAELQFAFLAFLVGQNYDSFEQWKRLVVLLCSCDQGIVDHPALFRDFLGDLYFQMKEVPRDFFVDIVSSSNFLCSSLHTLFTNIKDSGNACSELKERSRKFEANVTKRFGWDFSREEAEEEPLVVEPQRPTVLLSSELSE